MFENSTSTETVFWLCAVIGTVFFVFKFLMTLAGSGDFDLDGDADLGADTDVIDGHETEVAFKLLSLTSISAFIMMFGWSGLAAYSQYDLGAFTSLLIAIIVGTLSMFLIAYIFKVATKLTSGGSMFKQEDILGEIATVYHRIPAEGQGKVQVTIAELTRELDAVSEDKTEIESFKKVKIVKFLNQHTVVVQATKESEE